METKNVSNLKIHKLTQAQYDRELAAGNIDEYALYLTPDEEIDLSPYATVEQVNGKANATHDHAISDVRDLQTALDGKAASSHGTHVSYSTTSPMMDGTASVGTASTVARSDHKHPTDTSRAAKTDLDSHTSNTTVHITSTERTNWNAAKTHAGSAHAPSNAEKNQNAFSNIAVGSTTIAADSATDTLTLEGSNVTITPDATNDKVTIGITKDNVTSALGYTPPENDTHLASGTVVASSSTSVSNASDWLPNGSVYLNHIENGVVMNSHKISGSGSTLVSANRGNIDIYTEEPDLSTKMDTASPTGYGSLSINRKADTTIGEYSIAMGQGNTASGNESVSIGGYNNTASGTRSVTIGGNNNTASSWGSIAIGTNNDVTSGYAIGNGNTASGSDAVAMGSTNTASGVCSTAMGSMTTASATCSVSMGETTTASGNYSMAVMYYTTALGSQFACGYLNDTSSAVGADSPMGQSSATAFVIGNGSNFKSHSNAFRVDYNGAAYGKSAYTTNGCDYAEYFEWKDSNPENEDRRGYFVTLDSEKIKIAEPGDYILGIISGHPAVIGNGDESWMGRYILDDFGDFIYEDFEYEVQEPEDVVNEETGEVTIQTKTVKKTGKKYKENPDYDPSITYIQRADRPEWDAVGMIGVLSVRDDGTCQVNGYCKVAAGGTATTAESGYRVVKRVNDSIVKVIFK